jgi:zinc and cadmium transporter
MNVLASILLSTGIISTVALFGGWILTINRKLTNRILPHLVGLAAGTMLASSFLHLLPEALEVLDPELTLQLTLASFIIFLIIEKLFHWHHHELKTHRHHLGVINLIGDTLHNFLDGFVIAAAFLINPALGITTTLAVALHELPQEIGDFGILLLSGFSQRKALIFNFLVATTIMLGGITAYLFQSQMAAFSTYLLPIAAGNFLYLSATDLIPEIRNEHSRVRSFIIFLFFILGITLIPLIGAFEPEHTETISVQ